MAQRAPGTFNLTPKPSTSPTLHAKAWTPHTLSGLHPVHMQRCAVPCHCTCSAVLYPATVLAPSTARIQPPAHRQAPRCTPSTSSCIMQTCRHAFAHAHARAHTHAHTHAHNKSAVIAARYPQAVLSAAGISAACKLTVQLLASCRPSLAQPH